MTPEALTAYIVGCLRVSADIHITEAERLLAEHDGHRRTEVLTEAAERQLAYAREHWTPADTDSVSVAGKKDRKFGAAETLARLICPTAVLRPRHVRVLPRGDGWLVRWQVGEESQAAYRPARDVAEAVAAELRRMAGAAPAGKDTGDSGQLPAGEFTQPAPAVVCICGSTRFMAEMAEADLRETAAGRIVIKPGCDMKTPHPLWADPADAEALKVRLDGLHRAKIRMADEVLVVGDYVGDSTRAEIAYARELGKPVRFTHLQVDPSRACTRHTGADRERYGCNGPDPAEGGDAR